MKTALASPKIDFPEDIESIFTRKLSAVGATENTSNRNTLPYVKFLV